MTSEKSDNPIQVSEQGEQLVDDDFEVHNVDETVTSSSSHSNESSENGETNTTEEGHLDTFMIKSNLSKFGKNSEGTSWVYQKIDLNGMGLVDISGLTSYQHLQEIEVKDNSLSSLEPLYSHTDLCSLNAAFNQIAKPFDFVERYTSEELEKELQNDQYVVEPLSILNIDYSNNMIKTLPKDKSIYDMIKYLRTLNLSNNQLDNITSLQYLPHLQSLDVSNNNITSLKGIESIGLYMLVASHNNITSLDSINSENLRTLILDHNQLESLEILSQFTSLYRLQVDHNSIEDIELTLCLSKIDTLRHFSIQSNPCMVVEAVSPVNTRTKSPLLSRTAKKIRLSLPHATILNAVQQLVTFNGEDISNEQKVEALNRFGADKQGRLEIIRDVFEVPETYELPESIPVGSEI